MWLRYHCLNGIHLPYPVAPQASYHLILNRWDPILGPIDCLNWLAIRYFSTPYIAANELACLITLCDDDTYMYDKVESSSNESSRSAELRTISGDRRNGVDPSGKFGGVTVSVDGPYGLPHDFSNLHTLLLVSGGIGKLK
jgi:hypothetical protein